MVLGLRYVGGGFNLTWKARLSYAQGDSNKSLLQPLQVRTHSQAHHSTSTTSSETPADAQTVTLPNGRILGFAEYGQPNGTPLLYFHGFPTCRLESSGLHTMAARRNIRLISIERPGFGLSTHDPKRRIMDWPTDVHAFAVKLGLKRFAILGVSGGGPYALACAQKLPSEMMSAVGVLAGAGLWDKGFWTPGVLFYTRLVYLGANYWPSGLKVVFDGLDKFLNWLLGLGLVQRRIEGVLETRAARIAKNETEKMEDEIFYDMTRLCPPFEKVTNNSNGQYTPESPPPTYSIDTKQAQEAVQIVQPPSQRRERLIRMVFEAFAQGTSGTVHETRLLTRDWGIDFENITYNKVRWWHGAKDTNAPIRTIREMAKRMPHCVLKEFEDESHYQIGIHFDEVLEELVPEAGDSNKAIE